MDGKIVVLANALLGVVYVPPRQEDKPELLTEVLASVKQMNQDGKDMKDIAILVSSSLNAIHPYLDANGRTSRLIYSLLAKNFNKETKSELQQVLLEHGRDKININPEIIRDRIDFLIGKEVGANNPGGNTDYIGKRGRDIKFREKVDEGEKKLFLKLYEYDNQYLSWSAFKYLQNNPGIEKEKYLKRYSNRIVFDKPCRVIVIVLDKLCRDLTPEGLTQILQIHGDLKKKYVKTLIDCVVHPEKKEYQIGLGDRKTTLKSYFENWIKEETEKHTKNFG